MLAIAERLLPRIAAASGVSRRRHDPTSGDKQGQSPSVWTNDAPAAAGVLRTETPAVVVLLRLCSCCEPQQRPGVGTSAWWSRIRRTSIPQVQALDCCICLHCYQRCCAYLALVFPNVFEPRSVIIYFSTGEVAACPLLCPLLCQHLPFAGALWAAVFLVGRLLLRARGGSCDPVWLR